MVTPPTTRSANRAFKSIYGRRGGPAGRHLRPTPPDTNWYDVDPRRLSPQQVPPRFWARWRNFVPFRLLVSHPASATRWGMARVVRMAIATDITDKKRRGKTALQQERLQRTSRLIVTMGDGPNAGARFNQPLAAIANYSRWPGQSPAAVGEYRRGRHSSPQKASAQAERAGWIIRRGASS